MLMHFICFIREFCLLQQHLEVNAGDTKAAVHRNQHQYDALNLSQGVVLVRVFVCVLL